MARSFRRERGFTLIELVVVIVILGLGAAMSTPVINDFTARYRLRATARDVASVLQLVRLEAIKRKVNCVVTFSQSINGETFDYAAFVDDSGDWDYDAGETILASRDFPRTISIGSGGVTFGDNGEGLASVAFNSRGLPRKYGGGAGTGTVNLKNQKGGTKQVVVASSGRIRID